MKRHRVSLIFPKWTVPSILAAAVIVMAIHGALQDETPPSHLDADARVCFTPDGACQDKLIFALAQARHEILVMTYAFTAKPLAKALLDAHKRGVHVRVIADSTQAKSKYSFVPWLAKKGIPVTFDASVAISHNKVMLIDGRIVVTGSYNFTNAGEYRNAENILFIESVELANQYKSNWLERFVAATSFSTDSGDRPVRSFHKKHAISRH